MNSFTLNNNILHAENVGLNQIAREFGTPCYVYSKAALTLAFERFSAGFIGSDHLVCFAVKSNPSLAILNLFAKLGAGFDIVSGGELARVLAAGGDPKKIVFSGVGKTAVEMQAALDAGIFCFNVESASELTRLNKVAAEMGKVAPVSLRVNPNVDAKTHPYISTGLKNNKFGVAYEDALSIYLQAAAMSNIAIHGVDCHIGSQITELSPFLDAFDRVLLLVDALQQHGIEIQHIDAGGGIGICYSNETPPEFKVYAKNVLENAKILGETLVGHGLDLVSGGTDSHLLLVDLRKYGLTGKDAEITLEHANITCNKNGIPFDPLPPMTTSGIRIGSPAATSRGLGREEFKLVADLIAETLKGLKSGKAETVIPAVKEQVLKLCSAFPIYQDL